MGWLVGWNTRKELITHLNGNLAPQVRLLGSSVTSFKTHWMLVEITRDDGSTYKTILLNLIGQYSGQWGYKDMCISMGPYYYDAPLWMVKEVEEAGPPCDNSAEWIKRYHEIRDSMKAKRSVLNFLRSGMRVWVNGEYATFLKFMGKSSTTQPVFQFHGGETYGHGRFRFHPYRTEIAIDITNEDNRKLCLT